jgi:hypothetical protein
VTPVTRWDEMTGPERIRAGIERDRGGRTAPQVPVRFICREDDGPPVDSRPPETHAARRRWSLAGLLMCPGCLCLRFGPGHLTCKLFGIDCRHM